MRQTCFHAETEFVTRRDGIDYVRCTECGQVFEEEDLESAPAYDEDEVSA